MTDDLRARMHAERIAHDRYIAEPTDETRAAWHEAVARLPAPRRRKRADRPTSEPRPTRRKAR